MVSKLGRGAKSPSPALAQKIADLGPPWPAAADWAEALPAREPRIAREPHEVPTTVTAADTAGEAAKLLAHIRDLQDEIRTAGVEEGGLQAKVRMVAQLAEAIDKLGRHTGIKLTTRQILSSPLWREVEDAVTRACAGQPEVMRRIADELEALEA